MEIDLYIPKVAFYIENTPAKPFEKQLPEIYKEQQVYLFVALANKDDIIEILPWFFSKIFQWIIHYEPCIEMYKKVIVGGDINFIKYIIGWRAYIIRFTYE